MSAYLYIDPGVRSACARFDEGHLTQSFFAGLGDFVTPDDLEAVVIEAVHFRGATDLPKVKNLIRMLATGYAVAGAAAGASSCPIEEYTPGEWKGTEPKPVQHARMWACLTHKERRLLGGEETHEAIEAALGKGARARWKISGAECYPRTFVTHNRLDAAALGCVHLGRLEKR